ncbi:hypothetical protein ACFJGV_10250 [Cnuibacter sp. UC19_7]|uniref:hypothetical protein n=1 Tax=Cnuibacter sp. UC19_7 TaxID=3350166 RepID=UPI00366D1E0F
MSRRDALRRLLTVTVPVIVVNAAVQAVTVLPGTTPGLGMGFVLLTLVSFVSFSASAALLAAASLPALSAPGRRRLLLPVATWAAFAALVLAVALSSLVSPVLLPIVATVALVIAPGLASGAPRPRSIARPFAATPLRAALLTIVSLLVTALGLVVALLVGFFIAGPWSALLTWLVLGGLAAALLHAWARLWARAAPRE